MGIYTDPQRAEQIYTGQHIWANAGPSGEHQAYVATLSAMGFRTIYAGRPTSHPGSYTAVFPTPGQLAFAPIGLGNLIHSGYVGDVRSSFCPSTGGELPWFDTQPSLSGVLYPSLLNIGSLARIQRAGGFDARSLSHGDWSSLIYDWHNDPIGNCSIQGTYNYRNVPCIILNNPNLDLIGAPFHPRWGLEAHYPAGNDYQVELPYTKPRVRVSAGGPVFKTQKILGSRALVVDSFSRVARDIYVGGLPDGPGDGFQTHREGYNVLYGDWSAKWYGDPQQRIMWWPWYSNPANPKAGHAAQKALQFNGLFWYETDGIAGYASPPDWSSATIMSYYRSDMIWHDLDVANQVDVDAKGTVAP